LLFAAFSKCARDVVAGRVENLTLELLQLLSAEGTWYGE
jgi:hypothetical protein